MPTCKRCQKSFPSTVIIDGKRRSLTSRYYCLECNPYGERPSIYGVKRKATDEEVVRAVASSYSYAQVLRSLNMNIFGSAYPILKRRIKQLGLSTEHFTGASHLKGKTHNHTPARPLSDLLVKNSPCMNRGSLKRRLLKEGLLKYCCDECKLDKWQGKPISLQLEHKNGDGQDNRLENLTLLCPNCHSQTKTFCRKKAR